MASSTRRSVRVAATMMATVAVDAPPRKRAKTASKEVHSEPELEVQQEETTLVKKRARRTAVEVEAGEAPKKKTRTTKKGKEKAEPQPEDYPARVANACKVGAHVSAAGGVENAVTNAAAIGANAFALFVKSQRKWTGPPTTAESIAAFTARLKRFGYAPGDVLPHGSYLVNLGNPDASKRAKSYECFLDELKRCEQLGLVLYNFHPGSTVGCASPEESLALIAQCINRAHKETKHIVTVLENTAGAGNVLGSTFRELGSIIEQVEDKTRVGVCLDTCHMFAAGYDIRTRDGWDSTMSAFDAAVGMRYLKGMHLNDSKAELGSKKDRHENIGLGHLGLRAFSHILRDPRTRGVPLVLETPTYGHEETVWKAEVEVLNRLALSWEEEQERDGGDAELEAWTAEIREVVESARAAEAKGKRKKEKAPAKRKVKGKGKKSGEDGALSELSELTDEE